MRTTTCAWRADACPLLRERPADLGPKTVIRLRGDDGAFSRPRVLVTGSRTPSQQDLADINRVIHALSRNDARPLILSGLALGTDAAVHRAALAAGLPTAAVLPTGLDTVYPRCHEGLAAEITASGGALVTPFPDGTAPEAALFLERMTVAVAMADLVIVANSRMNGSAMIAARRAYLQDVTLLALPGRIDDPTHAGTNLLIANGAAQLVADFGTLQNYYFGV